MLTMQVLRPKSAIDVAYCADYPRVITRQIPQELFPVACALCGERVEDWRVRMGLSYCGACGKDLAKLRRPKAVRKAESSPSVAAVFVAAVRNGKAELSRKAGWEVWRKCNYQLRKALALVGADLESKVTRQTLSDATIDVVTEYYRRLSTIDNLDGLTKTAHWRVIRYSVKEVLRAKDGRPKAYTIGDDGAFTAKPIAPRSFTPVSSYLHSWELLEPLKAEISAVMAKLGQSGEFDLLDSCAMLQSSAPELWAGIVHRVTQRGEQC